jgi:nicotinamidase/pyrazinamidase
VPRGDEIVSTVNRLGERFRHVVLSQDWHPALHKSFASTHPGKQPFETVSFAYGPQVLWPDHCVQGTPGAQFHAGLDVPHAELVLRKGYRREIDSYSVFYENDRATPTGLAGYLRERGLKRVFLVGLALDVCVRYSAEDAQRCGLEAVVIEEACRGIDVGGSMAAAAQAFAKLAIARVGVEAID